MLKYNDNELLYLALEGSEKALEYLVEKYEPLIRKRLTLFKVKKDRLEDFFQEGRMALIKSISTFNPLIGKTFNRYFDLVLQRRIISIFRKEAAYFYKTTCEEEIYISERATVYDSFLVSDLKLEKLEQDVFYCRFREKRRPTEIAKLLNIDIKKVYNVLFAIKSKGKKYFKDNDK